MKKYLPVIFLISVFVFFSTAAFAQGENLPQEAVAEDEIDLDLPLCLPGMSDDGTCLPYGAFQTVQALRAEGFPYPIRELPAAPPSPDLAQMPVLVAKINYPEDEPAPVFASFDDAVAGVNAIGQIDPGTLRYVSYVSRLDQDGKAYLQLASGGWMRAAPASYTDFQGLIFYENPQNDFGWIVDQTESYQAPSFSAALTGRTYYREDVIQIYNVEEAEGVTWYQVAPGEWVYSLKARWVDVNPVPPEGVESNRWIEINLLQQTMSVYENGRLLFSTLIATGLEPFYTQPGVFQIYEKKPFETMQGAFEADRSDFYYLQDVPWTMYFDQARALHAAYWRTFFGYPQSHGCVNLSPGDAQWLFDWASEGDYVWVHDPSGRTPTDAEYYGPGAP